MSAEKPPPFGQGGFKPAARKTVKVSQEALVATSPLGDGSPFPLVVQPNVEHVNLLTWAQTNQEFIDSHLLWHGGLLFRGFGLDFGSEPGAVHSGNLYRRAGVHRAIVAAQSGARQYLHLHRITRPARASSCTTSSHTTAPSR